MLDFGVGIRCPQDARSKDHPPARQRVVRSSNDRGTSFGRRSSYIKHLHEDMLASANRSTCEAVNKVAEFLQWVNDAFADLRRFHADWPG